MFHVMLAIFPLLFAFFMLAWMILKICAVFVTVWLMMSYCFESIAVARFRKNGGAKHTFSAWLPFYNKYLLGKLTGGRAFGVWLGVTCLLRALLLGGALAAVRTNRDLAVILSAAALSVTVVAYVLNSVAAAFFFDKCSAKSFMALTVCSIVSFGTLRPILLFAVRKKAPCAAGTQAAEQMQAEQPTALP